MPQDVVTIALYSLQDASKPKGYNEAIFNELANIRRIQENLAAAARKAGRQPPKVVVSTMLIPDWSTPGNSFDDQTYRRQKDQFMAECHTKMGAIPGVEVQDFYKDGNLTPDQKAYLHQNHSRGINIDMMKSMAVVNNQGNRHLQIDSNTQVMDFDALYQTTFNARQQADALNAIIYSHGFVSAHNKVVYTHDRSTMPSELGTQLRDGCTRKKSDPNFKKVDSNYVYSVLFTAMLGNKMGWSRKIQVPNPSNPSTPQNFNCAVLDDPGNTFRLTGCIASAVKKSWSASQPKPADIQALEAILPVQVGTVSCDFALFQTLVKKYTDELQHQPQSNQQGITARQWFLQLSNVQAELALIMAFIEHTRKNHSAQLARLLQEIRNTPLGDELVGNLFGRGNTVASMYQNPTGMVDQNNKQTMALNAQDVHYPFAHDYNKASGTDALAGRYTVSDQLTYKVSAESALQSVALIRSSVTANISTRQLDANFLQPTVQRLSDNQKNLLQAEAKIVRTLQLLEARYKGIADDLGEKTEGSTYNKWKIVHETLQKIQQGQLAPRAAIDDLLKNDDFTKRIWRFGFDYKAKGLQENGAHGKVTGLSAITELKQVYDACQQQLGQRRNPKGTPTAAQQPVHLKAGHQSAAAAAAATVTPAHQPQHPKVYTINGHGGKMQRQVQLTLPLLTPADPNSDYTTNVHSGSNADKAHHRVEQAFVRGKLPVIHTPSGSAGTWIHSPAGISISDRSLGPIKPLNYESLIGQLTKNTHTWKMITPGNPADTQHQHNVLRSSTLVMQQPNGTLEYISGDQNRGQDILGYLKRISANQHSYPKPLLLIDHVGQAVQLITDQVNFSTTQHAISEACQRRGEASPVICLRSCSGHGQQYSIDGARYCGDIASAFQSAPVHSAPRRSRF